MARLILLGVYFVFFYVIGTSSHRLIKPFYITVRCGNVSTSTNPECQFKNLKANMSLGTADRITTTYELIDLNRDGSDTTQNYYGWAWNTISLCITPDDANFTAAITINSNPAMHGNKFTTWNIDTFDTPRNSFHSTAFEEDKLMKIYIHFYSVHVDNCIGHKTTSISDENNSTPITARIPQVHHECPHTTAYLVVIVVLCLTNFIQLTTTIVRKILNKMKAEQIEFGSQQKNDGQSSPTDGGVAVKQRPETNDDSVELEPEEEQKDENDTLNSCFSMTSTGDSRSTSANVINGVNEASQQRKLSFLPSIRQTKENQHPASETQNSVEKTSFAIE